MDYSFRNGMECMGSISRIVDLAGRMFQQGGRHGSGRCCSSRTSPSSTAIPNQGASGCWWMCLHISYLALHKLQIHRKPPLSE